MTGIRIGWIHLHSMDPHVREHRFVSSSLQSLHGKRHLHVPVVQRLLQSGTYWDHWDRKKNPLLGATGSFGGFLGLMTRCSMCGGRYRWIQLVVLQVVVVQVVVVHTRTFHISFNS